MVSSVFGVLDTAFGFSGASDFSGLLGFVYSLWFDLPIESVLDTGHSPLWVVSVVR